METARRLPFRPTTPITNCTVDWAALSVACSAIKKLTRTNFTVGLVNQMALTAHLRDSTTSGSARMIASAVVAPFTIDARSLRASRRIFAGHRAEEGTATIITAWNTTTRFIVNHSLLQPSSRIRTAAITVRILIISHCAIHRAAREWWVATDILQSVRTRSAA